jgi:hypothetical protein
VHADDFLHLEREEDSRNARLIIQHNIVILWSALTPPLYLQDWCKSQSQIRNPYFKFIRTDITNKM